MPEFYVATTQCGALNVKQDFARAYFRLWPILNRHLSIPQEARTTHHF
jgi:hypothetical protein